MFGFLGYVGFRVTVGIFWFRVWVFRSVCFWVSCLDFGLCFCFVVGVLHISLLKSSLPLVGVCLGVLIGFSKTMGLFVSVTMIFRLDGW